MGVEIAGFICALVLAGIVIAWIAFCMFVRERHKSEAHQYTISDLKHRNQILSMGADEEVEKEIKVGVLVLPTPHKQKDEEYGMRPDYPESPAPMPPSTERLFNIINESADDFYKDGIYEVDSSVRCHSDV